MILVGVAYTLLLRRTWKPQGGQLVADETLQSVMPLLALAYWWFAVPKGAVRWSDIPRSRIYPVGYVAYVIVRGEITGRYPYNFVDVGQLGYGRVLMNATVGLLAFAAIALALVGASALKKSPSPAG